jgi:hypothetical protein
VARASGFNRWNGLWKACETNEGCRSNLLNGLWKAFESLRKLPAGSKRSLESFHAAVSTVGTVFGKPVKACQRCRFNRWNGLWKASESH